VTNVTQATLPGDPDHSARDSERVKCGVTVVLATLERGDYLLNTVSDLLAQTHRPLEILIIDQSRETNPKLKSLVTAHPDLISYHQKKPLGIAGARNCGWQLARHEAILFTDDDIRCGPDLVFHHVRTLCLPQVGLVAGGIDELGKAADREPTGRFNFWTATPHRGFACTDVFEVDHVPGGNFSTWRAALSAAGGIDENLSIGAGLYEETEFSLRIKRAGFLVLFNGQARLLHLAAATGGCRVKDMRKYVWGLGHNRAILIRRHLRWFQMPTALARLAGLAAAYAWHYRDVFLVSICARSFTFGWRSAANPPVCSRY
jgi:GT2 family glycosyltransferase